ncbi:hypothetical protein LUU34_01519600 [Aix galericulata]|nr:hypothetical protein LUU34_01519600 [Aix galericulata]
MESAPRPRSERHDPKTGTGTAPRTPWGGRGFGGGARGSRGVLSPGQDAAPPGTACTPLLVLVGCLLPASELSRSPPSPRGGGIFGKNWMRRHGTPRGGRLTRRGPAPGLITAPRLSWGRVRVGVPGGCAPSWHHGTQ